MPSTHAVDHAVEARPDGRHVDPVAVHPEGSDRGDRKRDQRSRDAPGEARQQDQQEERPQPEA
jgi:hypothetical protein